MGFCDGLIFMVLNRLKGFGHAVLYEGSYENEVNQQLQSLSKLDLSGKGQILKGQKFITEKTTCYP